MNTENLDKLEELSLHVGRIKGVADMLFQAHSDLGAQPFEGMHKETPPAVFALMFDELGRIEKGIEDITSAERKAGAA